MPKFTQLPEYRKRTVHAINSLHTVRFTSPSEYANALIRMLENAYKEIEELKKAYAKKGD